MQLKRILMRIIYCQTLQQWKILTKNINMKLSKN